VALVTPDIGLIIWQLIVFLTVLIILRAFVWKPILDALRTREYEINDALEAASKAKEEMAQIQSDNEYLLKEARIERDEILKKATEAANQIKEDAKAETSKIAEKMIEDAKATISSEKNSALAEVKQLVSSLSLEIAEKIIKEQLKDDKAQKDLVQKFLGEVKVN